MCENNINDDIKSTNNINLDDDMAKTHEEMKMSKKQHSNTNNIEDILEKGINRYDKALVKLSS